MIRKIYSCFFKSHLVESLGGLITIGIVIVCFTQVVARHLNISYMVGWTEEFSRLFFVWGSFIGIAVCVKEERNLSVNFLYERLPKKSIFRIILKLFKHVVMATNTILFIYFGLVLALRVAPDHTTTLGYSKSVFYWSIPVCALLMIIYIISMLIDDISVIVKTTRK